MRGFAGYLMGLMAVLFLLVGCGAVTPAPVEPAPVATAVIHATPTASRILLPEPVSEVSLTMQSAPVVQPEWTSYSNIDDIQDMLFDQEGTLWVATQGGLLRWDVEEDSFIKYTMEHGLAGNDISSLAMTSDGVIWAGTNNGLSRFDGREWRSFAFEQAASAFKVTSIAVDAQDQLWVVGDGRVWCFSDGKWRSGELHFWVVFIAVRANGEVCAADWGDVFCFDGERWEKISASQRMGNIQSLVADTKGNLWVGTRKKGFRFDGRHWDEYGEDQPENVRWDSLWADSDGGMWAGIFSGVAFFNGEKWVMSQVERSFSSVASAIEKGPDGKIWLGADGGRIYHFVGDDWEHQRTSSQFWVQYNFPDSPDFSVLTDLAVAPDGTLWMGSHSDLQQFKDEQWVSHRRFKEAYYGLTFAPEGDLWVYVNDFVVYHFDGKNWQRYGLPEEKVKTGRLSVMAVAGDGTVWAGIDDPGFEEGLLYRLDREQGPDFVDTQAEVGTLSLRALATAPDGSLWVGTGEGVLHYADGKWVTYTTADGLLSDGVLSLAVSPEGVLWVGSLDGISCFDGKVWQTYTFPNYDKPFPVVAHYLSVAADGTVWAYVFPSGVMRFDGQSWETYLSTSRLGFESIEDMVVLPDGAIWLSTTAGLLRYWPVEGPE